MLELEYSEEVGEFLDSLPTKVANQIFKKLEMLCGNPRAGNTSQLVGYPLFRTRAGTDLGEARIIHEVENGDTLFVSLIGFRNDDEVYKELRKRFG